VLKTEKASKVAAVGQRNAQIADYSVVSIAQKHKEDNTEKEKRRKGEEEKARFSSSRLLFPVSPFLLFLFESFRDFL
jgi:hypothetical protein